MKSYKKKIKGETGMRDCRRKSREVIKKMKKVLKNGATLKGDQRNFYLWMGTN